MQSPFVSFAANQPRVLEIVFVLIFFVWAIYTIVMIYHWIKYGHRSKIAIPAIIIHLIVSTLLFLMAASGFA